MRLACEWAFALQPSSHIISMLRFLGTYVFVAMSKVRLQHWKKKLKEDAIT